VLSAVLDGSAYSFNLGAQSYSGISFDVVPIAVGDIEFSTPFATAIDLVSVSSIASGSSASNTSVTLGQAQLVLGKTLGITVASRGEQDVSGTASNTVIASGGLQLVFSGGTASGGGTIDHGIQYVFAGGSASGTLVASDGTQGAFGTAISTTVSGVQYVGGNPYSGADAVLSEGRYCIGSTGAEFLRISK
jgi:autotransporter passenger strand-loop-strand repeat protein